jgi:hypothetical protein
LDVEAADVVHLWVGGLRDRKGSTVKETPHLSGGGAARSDHYVFLDPGCSLIRRMTKLL